MIPGLNSRVGVSGNTTPDIEVVATYSGSQTDATISWADPVKDQWLVIVQSQATAGSTTAPAATDFEIDGANPTDIVSESNNNLDDGHRGGIFTIQVNNKSSVNYTTTTNGQQIVYLVKNRGINLITAHDSGHNDNSTGVSLNTRDGGFAVAISVTNFGSGTWASPGISNTEIEFEHENNNGYISAEEETPLATARIYDGDVSGGSIQLQIAASF